MPVIERDRRICLTKRGGGGGVQVEEACREANAADFVAELPQGYATVVSQARGPTHPAPAHPPVHTCVGPAWSRRRRRRHWSLRTR
jgi:hypothetical protein